MTARLQRRSIRLREFDYGQAGAYFVTLCVRDRRCLFGSVKDGEISLSDDGRIVLEEWNRTAEIRSEVRLDETVVMPNHLHGIVVIDGPAASNGLPPVGAHGRAPLRRAPRSLGSFVAGFKAAVTRRINERRGTPGVPVWQRNYFEHVIRNEVSLGRIRQYIAENPIRWDEDPENPEHAMVKIADPSTLDRSRRGARRCAPTEAGR